MSMLPRQSADHPSRVELSGATARTRKTMTPREQSTMALSEPERMRAAAMQATRARYTKTDYEMVASILKTQRDAAQAMNNTARDAEVIAQMTSDTAHRFAEAFARDCPKFDRVRFLRIAGCNHDSS